MHYIIGKYAWNPNHYYLRCMIRSGGIIKLWTPARHTHRLHIPQASAVPPTRCRCACFWQNAIKSFPNVDPQYLHPQKQRACCSSDARVWAFWGMWARCLVGGGASELGLRASGRRLLRALGAGCAGKRQASSGDVSAGETAKSTLKVRQKWLCN